MADWDVFMFPHSGNEFVDIDDLRQFLGDHLVHRQGLYRVVSPNRYLRIRPGDLAVFHKNRELVGQARVLQGLRLYDPPELVPGQVYQGFLIFDPMSVIVYQTPLDFDEVLRKYRVSVNSRVVQKITQSEYQRIMK